jgi:hypothetical protein
MRVVDLKVSIMGKSVQLRDGVYTALAVSFRSSEKHQYTLGEFISAMFGQIRKHIGNSHHGAMRFSAYVEDHFLETEYECTLLA